MKNKKLVIFLGVLIVLGVIFIIFNPFKKSESQKLEKYLIKNGYVNHGGTYYNELDWTIEEYFDAVGDKPLHDYWFKGIDTKKLEYKEMYNLNINSSNLRNTYSYNYNYQTDMADGYYVLTGINGNDYHRYYSFSYNYKSGTSECIIKSYGIEIGQCTLSSEFAGKEFMKIKSEFLDIINSASIDLDKYYKN